MKIKYSAEHDYIIVENKYRDDGVTHKDTNTYPNNIVWLTKLIRELSWVDYDKYGIENLYVLRWCWRKWCETDTQECKDAMEVLSMYEKQSLLLQ